LNRGYCKRQPGDLQNAFADLHSLFEMNPDDSFAWRNLGAYCLTANELDKAIQHFEEAEKTDTKTELINFYLGHTDLKMGNSNESKYDLHKSIDCNEHNDSIIE
jgi:tetratricopeptide (TPR) repeat protein